MVAPASVKLGKVSHGPQTSGIPRRFTRGAACAQPRASPPRACARSLARQYRFPGLRAVHQRLGQARTLRASPAAGARPGLMFPCPKSWSLRHCSCLAGLVRPVSGRCAAIAQLSPCVSHGGPTCTNTWGLPAPGDNAAPLPLSLMSCPARPPTSRDEKAARVLP